MALLVGRPLLSQIPQVTQVGTLVLPEGTAPVVVREDPKQVEVDLTGVRVLDLVVGDAGDGGYNDRADWAAPTAIG